MKLVIKNTTASEQTVGIGYGIVGLVGLILTRFDSFILRIMPRCTFHKLTGLPCPSCGATRAGIYLGHLQIARSFLENPIYFVLYVSLFFYALNSLVGALFYKNIELQTSKPWKKVILPVLLIAISLNWLYLIMRAVI